MTLFYGHYNYNFMRRKNAFKIIIMIGDKYDFVDVEFLPDELEKNVVYNCHIERRIDLIC